MIYKASLSEIAPNRPGVSVSNTELPRHRLEAHLGHLVYISRRGVESEVNASRSCVLKKMFKT